MEQLSLPEIHRATLDLMDYIHRVCEENGIVYYLAYGTLIGTIRHGGFIPWDDDFDIQMPRKDYERFRRVMEEAGHPYYRLCDRKNTANYIYGIPRFSDSRYRYITTQPKVKPFDTGLFIDIYPLDNFGSTPEEARRIKKKIIRMNNMYEVYVNPGSVKGGIMSLVRGACHYLLRARYGSGLAARIDDMVMDKIRRMTSDGDRQIGEVCWDVQFTPYQREWFTERVLHDFEDRQYWIPARYEEILGFEYGDYMQLPPEENRKRQHDCMIVKA